MWNPADAIFSMANYLRAAGAPGDYAAGDLRLQPRLVVRGEEVLGWRPPVPGRTPHAGRGSVSRLRRG